MDIAVRTRRDAREMGVLVRDAIERLNGGRPVFDVRSLSDYVREASADTRFALFVLGAFAVLAVTLTAIGVYGVVAYATARRTREIAVRLALGADAWRIISLVVREGVMWSLAGLAVGVFGARVLTRYVEALLFHVNAERRAHIRRRRRTPSHRYARRHDLTSQSRGARGSDVRPQRRLISECVSVL
jgi:ABC-type antimicrobial peptide transport system permease subunit